jgi:small subunit ribosomal protein S3Ae
VEVKWPKEKIRTKAKRESRRKLSILSRERSGLTYAPLCPSSPSRSASPAPTSRTEPVLIALTVVKVETAVKGRVVPYLQADLTAGETSGYLWRKIRLIVDEVEGRNAKTSFYGLDTTRDEMCFLVKKWRTLVETYCDCKTKDGYILRLFTVAFTKTTEGQKRKTAYALASQVKAIRKKVVEILSKEVNKSDVTQVLNTFTTEVIHNRIQKEASKIFPVEHVKVRKIKVIQRPKIDCKMFVYSATKLNEMHDNDKRRKPNAFKGKRDRDAKKEEAPAATIAAEPASDNLVHA